MAQTAEYTIVDAFASTAFSGNAAAVVVLNDALPDETMQNVAREFNLPMTAFVRQEGAGIYAIRWFSPHHEDRFCGHATLASAHILLPTLAASSDSGEITFRSKPGELRARRSPTGTVELNFPAGDTQPASVQELDKVKQMVQEAMGDQVTVLRVDLGVLDVYIELDMAEGLHLRDAKIAQQPFTKYGFYPRNIMLTTVLPTSTSPTTNSPHIHSRFIYSITGGDVEDLVTGSSHCTVGPLYAPRFGGAGVEVRAAQGPAERNGRMEIVWDGKKGADGGRVKLRGSAVIVAKGTLFL